MALFVSCILTMHMMLYFFHHFELPFVLNTFQIRMRINNENVRISNQNQDAADEPEEADDENGKFKSYISRNFDIIVSYACCLYL